MPSITIIRSPTPRKKLKDYTLDGSLVKTVIDCEREIIAIGGELHADEEQVLLEDGSQQADLWGINLYPDDDTEQWIEFDSMINIRPQQGNRSRGIEDPATRQRVREIVSRLVR